jgi:hypothetical protein
VSLENVAAADETFPELSHVHREHFVAYYRCREDIKVIGGTLVPRINVENGIKLGFLLE